MTSRTLEPRRTGEIRSTGRCITLFLATVGAYSLHYNYRVHKEMRQYSGRGIGGGVALLLTVVANVAMPFITPAEVGSLYQLQNRPEPVRGTTGLWILLPFYVCGALWLAASVLVDPTGTSHSAAASLTSDVLLLVIAATAAGSAIWFTRTNRALNAYWRSLATSADAAPAWTQPPAPIGA